MVIWGSRGKREFVAAGQFFCPKCCNTRTYHLKRVSKYFTLYFIPLFKLKDLGVIVECQACKNVYKPSILEPGSQRLFKIVSSTKASLQHGSSLDEIRSRLMMSGADDVTAEKIIAMANIK